MKDVITQGFTTTKVRYTEIKQSRPFETMEQEVLLNLARTAAVLTYRVEQEFKPFDVTMTQYNLLRIVRRAADVGVSQSDIAKRVVTSTLTFQAPQAA
jgi:hypothetical protein